MSVAPALTGQLQVNTSVEILVPHTTPNRHSGMPPVGIVANEVRDHRVHAVEGFNRGMGIGVNEG